MIPFFGFFPVWLSSYKDPSNPTEKSNRPAGALSTGQIEPVEPAIGSPAADFRLPSSEGSDISLLDFKGKSHVVLFFVREFI
jgi:hypothetical protein